MAALTGAAIVARLEALVQATPFSFGLSASPFSFDQQPNATIDQVARIDLEPRSGIAGMNYREDRVDQITIWVARRLKFDAGETRAQLLEDGETLRAAIVRDALEDSGDYSVPDGGAGIRVQHDRNKDFAVLRLTLPVQYEAQL